MAPSPGGSPRTSMEAESPTSDNSPKKRKNKQKDMVAEPQAIQIYNVELGSYETVFVDASDPDPGGPRLIVTAKSIRNMQKRHKITSRRVTELMVLLDQCRTSFYKEIQFLRGQLDGTKDPDPNVFYFEPSDYFADDTTTEMFRTEIEKRTKPMQEELEVLRQKVKMAEISGGGHAPSEMLWEMLMKQTETEEFMKLLSCSPHCNEETFRELLNVCNTKLGLEGHAAQQREQRAATEKLMADNADLESQIEKLTQDLQYSQDSLSQTRQDMDEMLVEHQEKEAQRESAESSEVAQLLEEMTDKDNKLTQAESEIAELQQKIENFAQEKASADEEQRAAQEKENARCAEELDAAKAENERLAQQIAELELKVKNAVVDAQKSLQAAAAGSAQDAEKANMKVAKALEISVEVARAGDLEVQANFEEEMSGMQRQLEESFQTFQSILLFCPDQGDADKVVETKARLETFLANGVLASQETFMDGMEDEGEKDAAKVAEELAVCDLSDPPITDDVVNAVKMIKELLRKREAQCFGVVKTVMTFLSEQQNLTACSLGLPTADPERIATQAKEAKEAACIPRETVVEKVAGDDKGVQAVSGQVEAEMLTDPVVICDEDDDGVAVPDDMRCLCEFLIKKHGSYAKAFEYFDPGKRGTISTRDFVDGVLKQSTKGRYGEFAAKRLFSRVDVDADGQINFSDFEVALKEFPVEASVRSSVSPTRDAAIPKGENMDQMAQTNFSLRDFADMPQSKHAGTLKDRINHVIFNRRRDGFSSTLKTLIAERDLIKDKYIAATYRLKQEMLSPKGRATRESSVEGGTQTNESWTEDLSCARESSAERPRRDARASSRERPRESSKEKLEREHASSSIGHCEGRQLTPSSRHVERTPSPGSPSRRVGRVDEGNERGLLEDSESDISLPAVDALPYSAVSDTEGPSCGRRRAELLYIDHVRRKQRTEKQDPNSVRRKEAPSAERLDTTIVRRKDTPNSNLGSDYFAGVKRAANTSSGWRAMPARSQSSRSALQLLSFNGNRQPTRTKQQTARDPDFGQMTTPDFHSLKSGKAGKSKLVSDRAGLHALGDHGGSTGSLAMTLLANDSSTGLPTIGKSKSKPELGKRTLSPGHYGSARSRSPSETTRPRPGLLSKAQGYERRMPSPRTVAHVGDDDRRRRELQISTRERMPASVQLLMAEVDKVLDEPRAERADGERFESYLPRRKRKPNKDGKKSSRAVEIVDRAIGLERGHSPDMSSSTKDLRVPSPREESPACGSQIFPPFVRNPVIKDATLVREKRPDRGRTPY